MQRQRVAVIGFGGLFEASLVETLAAQRWLLVKGFQMDDPQRACEQIDAFGPHAVIVVRSPDDPLSEAMLLLLENRVPVVRLDPGEPALKLSLTASNATATLDRVLEILRAAAGLSGGRAPARAASSRKAPRAREVPHVGPGKNGSATNAGRP